MLSVIESDLRTSPFSTPLHTLAAGLDEYVLKQDSFQAPISALRDYLTGIDVTTISATDIIHLHGVNGALTISALERLSATNRVVWTLHDMNLFTGACHYSLGCSKFTRDCSECPAVKKPFRSSVKRNLHRKIISLRNMDDVTLVAPSKWLAKQAGQSQVLKNRSITTIANPVNSTFVSRDNTLNRQESSQEFRAVIVAQNLSDPVKQVELGVAGFLSTLQNSHRAKLTLVGKGGESFRGPDIVVKGPLDTEELAQEFEQADVIIVPSRAENSPLVIAEAAALGCVPLVMDAGGMPAMVSDLGYGTVFSSAEELTNALVSYSESDPLVRYSTREQIRTRARKMFSPAAAVAQYDKVYAST